MVQITSKFTIALVFSQGLEKYLRNLAIFYRVHEKCTSSRMHSKIFTTRQWYSSIETLATEVFVSKCVVPPVVCMSGYLDQKTYRCLRMYIFVGAYMH